MLQRARRIQFRSAAPPALYLLGVWGIGTGIGCLIAALAAHVGNVPMGIPFEYVLFVATLVGITLSHRLALPIAACGMVAVGAFKLLSVESFSLGAQLHHEWIILGDLLGLLVGFGLLADHFERSGIPERIPKLLPKGAPGAFMLLVAVFVLSGFLDNIAAAMIGGGVASTVFKRRVHLSYLAGIVVCSNAGGAGSVLGDTTTTMMWLDGIPPTHMIPAYIGATVTLVVCGIPASIVQSRYSPLDTKVRVEEPVFPLRLVCVAAILASAIAANVMRKGPLEPYEHLVPLLAVAIWAALLVTAPLARPTWSIVPGLMKTSLFLLCLVFTASMMPLENLPEPTAMSAFVIGSISAVFDNIPLTSLALNQGGYDWSLMAFAVGVGGSMLWFGSSAGVALCTRFPAGRSTINWVKHGWHIPVGYALGFLTLYMLHGWVPDPLHGGAVGYEEQHGAGVEEVLEAPVDAQDEGSLRAGHRVGE
jgi:Na+/H+ antiporter NhaD/arsenite permease-like protein